MKPWWKAALTVGATLCMGVRAAEDELTVITSDRLIYDYKQKFALFEGHVVVVDPRIKITADKMTVFFTPSNKVSAIKCEGHAVIQQTDKVAKAALATYDVASGDIVLTGGSPTVQSGMDTLSGDPIIFNRDRNTVRVEGTQQKPRLVIVPGSDSGSKDLLNLGVPGKKPDGGKPSP